MTLETLWGSKIDQVIERLRAFEPPEGYYLAFSGGKDSQAIYHLAEMAGVRYDAHYQVTTVDPPELLRFIREHYPAVIWERPEKSMFRLIVDKGTPPTRVIRHCCQALKERGGEGRVVLTGVRWAESNRRRSRQMVEPCYTGSKRFVHGIIDWTDDDVWSAHHALGLAHCELYDEGYRRIGCVMCPMAGAKAQARDAARWPRIDRMYRQAIARLYERRVARGDDLSWASAEEMYDWWVTGKRRAYEPDQMTFETVTDGVFV